MGTNVWTYRDVLRSDVQRDFVGYNVQASDGDIGKIDQATVETDRNYLVVDTGFWIFGKKRLIPAGVVTGIDHGSGVVNVAMTKEQIKQAPDFDEAMTSYDEAYYEKYGSYYGRFGW
jgi:hypothetical protein